MSSRKNSKMPLTSVDLDTSSFGFKLRTFFLTISHFFYENIYYSLCSDSCFDWLQQRKTLIHWNKHFSFDSDGIGIIGIRIIRNRKHSILLWRISENLYKYWWSHHLLCRLYRSDEKVMIQRKSRWNVSIWSRRIFSGMSWRKSLCAPLVTQ